MLRDLIKKIVLSNATLLKMATSRLAKRGEIVLYDEHVGKIDSANKVILNKDIPSGFLVGLVKDMVFPGNENYIYPRSYYPKYERFLRNNDISFCYYDVMGHNWIEEAKKLDVIVWHTSSDPNSQKIAKSKIYILDKVLGKKCLPSYDEIWSYEDKIHAHYLYKCHGLPEIPTFVSNDREDILQFIATTKFPVISKLSTGSASFGVEKISSASQATKMVNKVFSESGKSTYFKFDRQKNYVYFQEFIEDATFDLRIITIGDKAVGYYRYPNKGDFRASGAGNYEKKEIPVEALDLAFKVKDAYKATSLATDLLYSKKQNKYLIIESSIFCGVDTPRQLEVDNTPGYYQRVREGEYTFVKGEYWIQEFALCEILCDYSISDDNRELI